MRIAVGMQHLVELERARIDDQEAAGAHGAEGAFAGRQVNPFAVVRDAKAVILEHVLPAPGEHVVVLRGDGLARLGVDDGEARQGHTAQEAAVARAFGGDEYERVFLGVPGVGSA